MEKLKDAIVNRLINFINNPHTSGSAATFGLLKIAGIIWPQKKPILDDIAAAAVVWLGLQAGDASKSATKKEVATAINTGDTSFLVKPTPTVTETKPNP
jgi:hypothetical protein